MLEQSAVSSNALPTADILDSRETCILVNNLRKEACCCLYFILGLAVMGRSVLSLA